MRMLAHWRFWIRTWHEWWRKTAFACNISTSSCTRTRSSTKHALSKRVWVLFHTKKQIYIQLTWFEDDCRKLSLKCYLLGCFSFFEMSKTMPQRVTTYLIMQLSWKYCSVIIQKLATGYITCMFILSEYRNPCHCHTLDLYVQKVPKLLHIIIYKVMINNNNNILSLFSAFSLPNGCLKALQIITPGHWALIHSLNHLSSQGSIQPCATNVLLG